MTRHDHYKVELTETDIADLLPLRYRRNAALIWQISRFLLSPPTMFFGLGWFCDYCCYTVDAATSLLLLLLQLLLLTLLLPQLLLLYS